MTVSTQDIDPGHHALIFVAKSVAVNHETAGKIKELDPDRAILLVFRLHHRIEILTFLKTPTAATLFDNLHPIYVRVIRMRL